MVPATEHRERVCRKNAGSRLGRGLLLALVLAAAAQAQQAGWQTRDWQTDQGLPDSQVTALEQTPDGYLWVGTPKGLARFDGIRFKVFDAERFPALGDDGIGALLVDRNGELWIATGMGRLVRYDHGRFPVVVPNETPGEAAAGGFMRDDTGKTLPISKRNLATLAEDAAGGVWLLTGAGGLLACHDGSVTRHTAANGLPPGALEGLCADDSGRIHLAAGDGLYLRNEGKWVREERVERFGGQLPPLLTAARSGGVWVAASRGSAVDGGRLVRRFEAGRWREGLENTPWIPNSMRSEVTALLADHAGRVWLGMLWNGVWHAAPGASWQRLEGRASLAQCVINCLFEDRQGSLWVGTDREGLYCISRRPVTVLTLPAAALETIITASCAVRNGSIWVGTDGAGSFRQADGEFVPYGKEQGLDSPHVCSIFEDRKARLWFGTWGGLFRFENGKFTRVAGPPELGQAVLALFEDRTGRLWAGTQSGLVSLRDGTWTPHKLLANTTAIDIRSLAEDAAGNLWVGTIGQGLLRLSGDEVTQFGCSGNLPFRDARALHFDPAGGGLWIGTMNHGLVRFKDGRFTAYTSADGLPCDTIGSIFPDDGGNLWIGSDNGIFACPLKVLENYRRGTSPAILCVRLGLAEGLVSRTCSGSGQPVPCRSADGRLWFPNFRGLAGFDPRLVVARPEAPEVLVEMVVVDGVDQRGGTVDELRVSSSARRFEFQYTAPELVMPQALRFRYRLAGMDPGWVDAGTQRVATYSQLPPGQYRFQVMAGGADGHWHEADGSLSLYVVPRLWERRWLQLLGSMLLVGAIASAILLGQRRRHRLRLARIQQARALEQERQRIAANIHDDLGASLTRITLLSDLARERAEAGSIGTELEQIHDTSRDLIRAMDEVVWAIAPEHDSLDSLVTYLGKIAQDLLRAAGVRCRLEIPATLPDLELSGQVRHNLLLASKEALHNVVKHAGAAEARVRASLRGDWFELTVSDDGHGFASTGGNASAAGNAAASRRPSAGRGLPGMAARLREIGGRCEVTSTPGMGTEVRFAVPLGPGGQTIGTPHPPGNG